MVAIREVSHRYEDGGGVGPVSLTVPTGHSLSIVGSTGCGKTTLLHCIAGLITPQHGEIELGNQGFDRVGLVQQRDALFPWLTVHANVDLGFRSERKKHPSTADLARRDELCEELRISCLGNRYPAELSGGERQRVAIARTLVSRPAVLLLDEPSAALDEFTRETLQDLVLSIQQEHHLTMVSVTHNIEEALFLGGRIVVMANGTVVHTMENDAYPDLSAREASHFYVRVVELRAMLQRAVRDDL